MHELQVTITRLVDNDQPGFVECEFTDAKGTPHVFLEKTPVVTTDHLSPDSSYPREGWIRCTLVEQFADSGGESLARVDTELPDHVESNQGETIFVVRASQLVSSA